MPKAKNIASVAALSAKLAKTKGLVLADYRGLTHKQLEDLRRKLKPLDAEFTVAKKTLLKIAGLPAVASAQTGPIASLFAYADPIAAIKELFKFIKLTGILQVKLGLIDNVSYSSEEVEKIAKLPDTKTLQTQLVSRLASPMSSLVYSLNYNLQKLVYVLEGVKNRV